MLQQLSRLSDCSLRLVIAVCFAVLTAVGCYNLVQEARLHRTQKVLLELRIEEKQLELAALRKASETVTVAPEIRDVKSLFTEASVSVVPLTRPDDPPPP
jgi:hypothetical protein